MNDSFSLHILYGFANPDTKINQLFKLFSHFPFFQKLINMQNSGREKLIRTLSATFPVCPVDSRFPKVFLCMT